LVKGLGAEIGVSGSTLKGPAVADPAMTESVATHAAAVARLARVLLPMNCPPFWELPKEALVPPTL
jgi:hypothetical protein